MPAPQTALSPQFSTDVATTETDLDFANFRYLLGALMSLSVIVLWLTKETPQTEPAVLNFSDASDLTAGVVLVLAFGVWVAGCTAIRRARNSLTD